MRHLPNPNIPAKSHDTACLGRSYSGATRLKVMGRCLLATHNIHVTRKWRKGKAWAAIKMQAPA